MRGSATQLVELNTHISMWLPAHCQEESRGAEETRWESEGNMLMNVLSEFFLKARKDGTQ